ncbi:uncharacterized protein BP5553_01539 [Venustampulla echinocandica]|uniref:Mediator of RNA polymerase II transcription subunit 17 n=1 Tax=Venustampulla echinocandica TaxID=2656787 RepID=A0A370U1A8_9HELO|nr:uncharacterized protein BP5553_01539 [Venustampulla echinocandica]RDL41560.1 hypothetical protein BP5553_01539 [Venustampulla echinocandica]
MASIPNEFPISLKPKPLRPTEPTLPTLIQRINFERGGFHNISEESLRQEIAEAGRTGSRGGEKGTTDEEEEDEEDDDDDGEDGEEEPDRMKELMKAREEILGQIDGAYQSAAYALDFVSLLLSKDTPVQASLSMSPALKELVGTGTMGADKIQASRVDANQKADNKRIAKGWKVQNLNKAVDTIVDSATRLEKEIETETKYWEQVLSVSNKGWAICRIPSEKQTLGVRFGFPEAAPNFRNQSLAALRRNPDGTIYIEQGITNAEPQTLRVRIQVNQTDTGSSSLSKPAAADAPVESLILQARNTIFNTELWQELNREARGLGAFGVRGIEDTLTLPLSPSKTIVLDLVPLADSSTILPQPDDSIAEGICLSLHILLSFAHRHNHRRRTQPPPPISNQKRPNPPYSLLRPLITRLNHQQSNSSLNSLLSSLCSALSSTKIYPAPSYKITHSSPQAPPIPNVSTSELTVIALTDRLESIANFVITPTTTITIACRSLQVPLAGTSFHLSLNAESPLTTTCVAPPVLGHISAVEEYILYATSCALASNIISISEQQSETEETDLSKNGKAGWHLTAQPNVLRKVFKGGKGKQFISSVNNEDGKGCKVRVAWNWMRHDFYGIDKEGLGAEEERRITGEGMYEWNSRLGNSAWAGGEGEVVRSLVDVVESAGVWLT